MEPIMATVSQLNAYMKRVVDGQTALNDIWIKGEISNFKDHYSGHLYITLKDDGGVLKAVMFKAAASTLTFKPEDGMKVIARGRIGVYEQSGTYQLYISEMTPDGLGELYVAYEQLKKKLGEEGLFDDKYKKPLPRYPKRVGIITSPTGAAIRDMTRILGRRFPLTEMLIYPSLVQGNGAASQLASGIRYFNQNKNVDVIIIGRGGGSIEDLWEFNNEVLAREIFASKIPVISAVGHESDFTICDFVADVRASTPSAAAELAVPEQSELYVRIENAKKKLALLASSAVESKRRRLAVLSSSPYLRSPMNFIDTKRMRVTQLLDRLDGNLGRIFERKKALYKEKVASLEALSPLAVLSRGYGASYDSDGKLIKSVESVKCGDSFRNILRDGEIIATVTDIKKEEK